MTPYFRIPLNLPHALKVARRIDAIVGQLEATQCMALTDQLIRILEPFQWDDPTDADGEAPQQAAADVARELVQAIIRERAKGDRLGQCIRNLFECLAMGQEGAEISLLAGENPNSVQRPV